MLNRSKFIPHSSPSDLIDTVCIDLTLESLSLLRNCGNLRATVVVLSNTNIWIGVQYGPVQVLSQPKYYYLSIYPCTTPKDLWAIRWIARLVALLPMKQVLGRLLLFFYYYWWLVAVKLLCPSDFPSDFLKPCARGNRFSPIYIIL